MYVTEAAAKKLAKMMVDAAKTKAQLAELRDKLRDQIDELQTVYESVSEGIDEFHDAFHDMSRAIDKMSEYV